VPILSWISIWYRQIETLCVGFRSGRQEIEMLLLISKSDLLVSISLLLVSKSDLLVSILLLLVSKSDLLVSILGGHPKPAMRGHLKTGHMKAA